jgi:adenosylcobinamide-phosphate synthase
MTAAAYLGSSRASQRLHLGDLLELRALPLGVGLLADHFFGDPPSSVHPVALFGRTLNAIVDLLWSDSRAKGAVLCGGALALVGALGQVLGQGGAALSLSTWVTLGEAQLHSRALDIRDLLQRGDLAQARVRCGEIVGRSTEDLGPGEICRAVVESVAENTADGVLGPLLYGSLCGSRGALLYRAVNTMDAMFGHRSEEFERFGLFAARVDDLVNLPVSRLGALLIALRCSPEQRGALRRAWSQARLHPSPNAGIIEAAFAVKLGVTLGGRNTYGDRVEERVLLGEGPTPSLDDIDHAVSISRRVTRDLLVVVACAELVTSALRGRVGWIRRSTHQRSRRSHR